MTDVSNAALAGQVACLIAALLWAVSVTLFRGAITDHGARTVNLTKCALAALLQGATLLALGRLGEILSAPAWAVGLVALSAVFGLVIGDTALFGAVARIGVHRTLLLQTLSPVFAALLAALWLAEWPTLAQSAGAALVLAGVGLVVAPTHGDGGSDAVVSPRSGLTAVVPSSRRLPPEWAGAGIALGVLAALGQGTGVVLAKRGMVELSFVPASFVRLATAALGLALLAAATGTLGRTLDLLRSRRALSRVVPATLLGTYLAIFLMMAGVAYAPAGVAAVLLSTSPVFSLVLERYVEGRPWSVRGLAGTAFAIAGVAVLTSG